MHQTYTDTLKPYHNHTQDVTINKKIQLNNTIHTLRILLKCDLKSSIFSDYSRVLWNWVRSVPSHWRHWHKKKKISREIRPLIKPAMPIVQKKL